MKHFGIKFFTIAIVAILLFQVGCKEDEKPTLPTVSTTEITNIEEQNAQSGGIVHNNGGALITSRGVCWSTFEDPTLTDNDGSTDDGQGIGEFTSALTNLLPNTTYYVRAYATNSAGTAYGDTLIFTTLPAAPLVPDNHHMLLGNPTSATSDVVNENDYLMEKEQYHLSYNNTTRSANWVSWHLNTSYLGSADRQDDFRPDYYLPSDWYRVSETSYRYSGFDRGHLCPSADRTLTISDNSATFVMTNMMPQAPNNNRYTWAYLEGYCRDLAKAGNELFIVAGPHGKGGSGSNGYAETIDNENIVVPNVTWKVIVVIEDGDNDLARITTSTRVIAVIMPNTQECSSKKWYEYRVSVDDIEELTGYDFLSNVSTSIQEVVEAVVDNVPI